MFNKKTIQRYTIKILISFALTLVTIGMLSTRANAAVTINVTQTGPDVQIIGTGTLNMGSVTDYIDTSEPIVTHNFNARNSGKDNFLIMSKRS